MSRASAQVIKYIGPINLSNFQYSLYVLSLIKLNVFESFIMFCPLFDRFFIVVAICVLFAISSQNPVSLGDLSQDYPSIDVSNDPPFLIDQFISDGESENSMFTSDVADELNNNKNEWNPGDMVAGCDNNSLNNGKRIRRSTFCVPRAENQQETQPGTEPPNGEEEKVTSPLPQDNDYELQSNLEKCPPEIYGPKSFVMCNSLKRDDNVVKLPKRPAFTLYDPYICKVQRFISAKITN